MTQALWMRIWRLLTRMCSACRVTSSIKSPTNARKNDFGEVGATGSAKRPSSYLSAASSAVSLHLRQALSIDVACGAKYGVLASTSPFPSNVSRALRHDENAIGSSGRRLDVSLPISASFAAHGKDCVPEVCRNPCQARLCHVDNVSQRAADASK